jgi:caffeoyl-CoA O-methyltransferase
MDEELLQYSRAIGLRDSAFLKRMRSETAHVPNSQWQIPPEQGQFLGFLVELMGARRILELGTYTGYSTLCMALALPEGGRVVTCDMDETVTAIAERYWREAGVAERIELRLGPATETVAALIDDGFGGRFDMAFIDANKKDYDTYYEASLELLRTGGLMAIDNVFWAGRVFDPANQEKSTRAIRALNEKVRDDPRVSMTVLPLNDGLTLARKRG